MLSVMRSTTTGLPPCPECGASDPVRIVYGYPSPETFAASERGEVRLGGCVVGPESPEFACRACDAELPWVARRRE
jgi:hypothetical protein